MAYDSEVSSDSEMLFEDGFDIRIDLEDLRKVLEPEDLEAADEPEQNAHQEEHHSSVEPRAQLQDASDCVAHRGIA